MSKFKKGDKVFLDKRGVFGNESRDWTLHEPKLIKNMIYTVEKTYNGFYKDWISVGKHVDYHEDHFKKYEQI